VAKILTPVLREKIIELYKKNPNYTSKDIARELNISVKAVASFLKFYKDPAYQEKVLTGLRKSHEIQRERKKRKEMEEKLKKEVETMSNEKEFKELVERVNNLTNTLNNLPNIIRDTLTKIEEERKKLETQKLKEKQEQEFREKVSNLIESFNKLDFQKLKSICDMYPELCKIKDSLKKEESKKPEEKKSEEKIEEKKVESAQKAELSKPSPREFIENLMKQTEHTDLEEFLTCPECRPAIIRRYIDTYGVEEGMRLLCKNNSTCEIMFDSLVKEIFPELKKGKEKKEEKKEEVKEEESHGQKGQTKKVSEDRTTEPESTFRIGRPAK